MPPVGTSLCATVLGTRDPGELARFYARLLGWRIHTDEPDWVTVRPADAGTGLSFQLEEEFEPPAWPAEPDRPRMLVHLDIRVSDLATGVGWAQECGARLTPFQPQDGVRVLRDPHGHLFCLFVS